MSIDLDWVHEELSAARGRLAALDDAKMTIIAEQHEVERRINDLEATERILAHKRKESGIMK